MTYFSNSYLTLDQMKVNAEYLYFSFGQYGWTANAICGMLGNMQTESTINPGIWESLTPNLNRGYGLVQWTPANKYFNWVLSNGYQDNIDTQIDRIIYELNNGLQWIDSNMSFYEFSQSTDTPYNLAMKFISAYERPADPNQPIRGVQANFWYEYLTGISPPTPTPKGENNLIELFLCGVLPNWK